ncbi:PREDICTED: uncharacterized protein LOC104744028 [Camelina sativa]|uniref:Uncharacterized protein LOC104744028 n=1 Tax=Camelina sativa TaxID=90675 RepID=A0ABM1QWK8_CAMSA|nr:PREDICTED: uncharacterized protein LOC104744028 [Camelina sativa]
MPPCQIHSAPSPPPKKDLSSSVSFKGWRFANKAFKLWVGKMAALHRGTWRKAGIYEAVMASTYKISKNTDLVLGIAEKWCPDTNTFVFSWGEATITLEDVMLLSGLPVLGSPVFAALDSSGEKIKAKLDFEWCAIKRRGNVNFVTTVTWIKRFMDRVDEYDEHVAFLVLWLTYFVLPSRYHHVSQDVFPIAIHLSRGTRVALAPAVLAHLYADLSLLKTHITSFSESTNTACIDLTALFKLVQVWTWERFTELQPEPNPLLKDEPRLALWSEMKQTTTDARLILDNSNIDSFEWRPYTKTVENWRFPLFYPEQAMRVPVSSSLDDELISFARCIRVSELVGVDNVEHYFPNRVASQFGILQDVPHNVHRDNRARGAAWSDYNKPISAMELCIPSRSMIPRVTTRFCEWWRKTFPEFQKYSSKEKGVVESAETSNARNIIGDSIVPSGARMNSTSSESSDEITISERLNKRKCMEEARDKRRKGMEEARDKRRKYVNQARETGSKTVAGESGKNMALIPFVGNKSSDPPLGGNKRALDIVVSNADLIDDGSKKPKCMEQARDKRRKYTSQPPEIGSKSMSDESGNNIALIPFVGNKTSDPPLGGNEGLLDIVVYGSNADLIDDGSNKPECLLKEDGIIAGRSDEKLCSNEAKKEVDDSYEKRFEELKVMSSTLEETINKVLKKVTLMKERKVEKLRKIAAARLI